MTPDHLTPAALTEALRRSGILREAVVVDVAPEQIGQELGFNGSLWRVVPSYDRTEPGLPDSLIAKFAQDAALAEKLDREARFYQEFRGPIGIRIPRAYLAESVVLLLEDLAPLKCGDVVAGCSGDEALMIVHHLARFHACGWRSPSLAQHEWLPRWPIQPERFHARLRQFQCVFLERFRPQLNDSMQKLTVRLVETIPRVIEELSQAPATLIHMDTHLDNLFYELPDTVVLIDWPSAAIGPGAVDLSRFLSASLPTPVRRSVEDMLLSEYLRILHEEGLGDYSFSDLMVHLKLAALRLWAGMVTGYGASNPDELVERQALLQQIELDRLSAVAVDWQLSQLLEDF